jgi:hypothetical protein
MGHMLEYMECFFDALGFPCPDTNVRTFSGQRRTRKQPQRKLKVMKDQELLRHHGDLGSFVIRVQHRQNSSWQGRITWMEKNKTVAFRSAFELMRLIEDALNTVTDYQGATWHTEQTHQKKNNENP